MLTFALFLNKLTFVWFSPHNSKHSIRATHQHHLELQDIHLPHTLATSSQAIPAIPRTQPNLIAQPRYQDILSPIQLLSKGTQHTNSPTSRPRSAPSQLDILKLFQDTFHNTFNQWSRYFDLKSLAVQLN